MKAVVASISVLTICILIFLGIYFFSGETIETAINNFEDQDYIESMVILNRLVKLSGYEKSEKINYYKCRAINKLAEQLEDEYSEELTELALEKKGTPDFDKLEKKILKELKEINSEIKGDLGLVLTRKKSRIISRGKFYDEFVTRYRGSSMIEDLDYEELLKIKKN